MTKMAVLDRSWLVQRLQKPHPGFGALGKDNPFNFGGGLRNGGLRDEAMDLLRGIFSFDYMGASEFEWGAVPEALSKLAKADLVAFSFAVPLVEVPKNWRDKTKKEPAGEATIYVLCPAEHKDEIGERISIWAREERPDLKEGLRLTAKLRPADEYDGEVCGWLELDNGFMFFTDEEMWAKTCELFGVSPLAAIKASRKQTKKEETK